MTDQQLCRTLQERFSQIVAEHHLENSPVAVTCRALTPEEAIGNTKRRDFPIITGKDIMVQAEYCGVRGQAFTDAPTSFSGSLEEILRLDILHDAHSRGLFIATLNAVMAYLGQCRGTVHCRTDGPEQCAQDMLAYLRRHYPHKKNIALIGYQPSLLEMLAKSEYHVRVLDLNPANIGQIRYGIPVEDGASAREDVISHYADLILCTGSTLCNGTIVDYMGLDVDVLFFGITLAGSADLLGLRRVCFADRYE
jgi:uncharacterized protein (DUF4213/DUF364 family)